MSTEPKPGAELSSIFTSWSKRGWFAPAIGLALMQVACRDRASTPTPQPVPTTASPTTTGESRPGATAGLAACGAAFAASAALPLRQRLHAIVGACPVCDWPTILRWGIAPTDGGPPLLQLRQALKACNVFCTGTADGDFFAGLEEARGDRPTRTPWRYLQNNCPALFAGGPAATRFAGAPWLALSRSLQIPAVQTVLSDASQVIELPLPLWTERGSGVALPVVAAAANVTDELGSAQQLVTLMATAQLLGTSPTARIHGTTVEIAGVYPGVPVELAALPRKASAEAPVVFVAPMALPAARLAAAIAVTQQGRMAVLTDAEQANWPLISVLRGQLVTPDLVDPSGLLIDIAHGGWVSLASVTTSANGRKTSAPPWQMLPPGPTLSARLASARVVSPAFTTDQVVLCIDPQTTVATVVEWVAALAPARWSLRLSATPAAP